MNLNTKAAAQNTYDAIVVGSGISGGWAAKELTEKGLKVLMLERGRNIEHIKDYTTAMKKPWEFEHRGKLTEEQKKTHPVQKRDYPYTEFNESFWVNDLECPYTEVKRFDWYRGFHVGGKSLMWGRQSYRLSDLNFSENLKDGHGVDWPIRYKDISPWYDYVEKFVGISGSVENYPHFPDGHYLPPMEMNIVEKSVKKRIEDRWKDRLMTIGRVANITVDHGGRGSCHTATSVAVAALLAPILAHNLLPFLQLSCNREPYFTAVSLLVNSKSFTIKKHKKQKVYVSSILKRWSTSSIFAKIRFCKRLDSGLLHSYC
jgi:choline dehydrogenase-like flavoprotein